MPFSARSAPTSSIAFTRLALALGLAAASCAQPRVDAPVASTTSALTAAATTGPGNLDVLFMIDNSSSMTVMQQKLASQIPGFVAALQNLPTGLPNIHIAVVSSDMGAPGDSTSALACTQFGDNGQFRIGVASGGPVVQHPGFDGGATGGAPGGDDAGAPGCAGASLNSGATYISNVDGVANYTGDLSTLVSCMTALGDNGCGFEHQLASISRALGADGSPAPSSNAGFLRPDAQLAIIVLSNEDDCSAPADTLLYSLNGGQQNISNPLGPIANYRCNQFGHLCRDPGSADPTALGKPPLNPPSDAQGSSDSPTLNLADCESNDTSSGLLTPVSQFIAEIKALKADPSKWLPSTGQEGPSEIWPSIEHSCGPQSDISVNPLATDLTTDGSFGDPAVRITQWVQAFGDNGVIGSICDDYGLTMGSMAGKVIANRGALPDAGTD
jgi:hypothetical protein